MCSLTFWNSARDHLLIEDAAVLPAQIQHVETPCSSHGTLLFHLFLLDMGIQWWHHLHPPLPHNFDSSPIKLWSPAISHPVSSSSSHSRYSLSKPLLSSNSCNAKLAMSILLSPQHCKTIIREVSRTPFFSDNFADLQKWHIRSIHLYTMQHLVISSCFDMVVADEIKNVTVTELTSKWSRLVAAARASKSPTAMFLSACELHDFSRMH